VHFFISQKWVLNRVPALQNTDQDDDHGHDEQNVNEPADSEHADNAKEPKDDEYGSYGIEHCFGDVV
jgi:hypothetical protein